jgi:holo-[acyl-carrier protein] synthase
MPRIGIDVVEVDRLAAQMERTPEFAERIFTAGERAYCERRRRRRFAHYAGRFAAKEAAFKALGTGWSGELCWTDVEVVPTTLGAPLLALHGAARRLADAAGVTEAAVTLSHSHRVAVAMVMLSGDGRPRGEDGGGA